MNQGDSNFDLKQQEKQKMLDELESLSRMLDEDLDDDDDAPQRPVPEDIPVLKSFVDDVPVLNERFEEALEPPSPAPQKHDSVDTSAARFNTVPNPRAQGRLDDSFLDNDPLEISAAVKQNKLPAELNLNELDIPLLQPEADPVKPPSAAQNAGVSTSRDKPAARAPVPPAPAAPAAMKPAYTPPATAPVSTAAKAKLPTSPPPLASQSTSSAAPQPLTAASVTQPLNRFQPTTKSENPFLPRSTLEKIRENHAHDASAELRKLIENNPLQKLSFDASPSSREYQALRQKASQLVNEVIRANMPRMEAELRLKLEQEVDRMFKDLKKK